MLSMTGPCRLVQNKIQGFSVKKQVQKSGDVKKLDSRAAGFIVGGVSVLAHYFYWRCCGENSAVTESGLPEAWRELRFALVKQVFRRVGLPFKKDN